MANPRQMTPYTYADSPIVSADDPAFAGGPIPGAPLPEARVPGGYLSDQLGRGFTLITTNPNLAVPGIHVVVIQPTSEAAQVLGADPNSAYLVRPDSHIAARWFDETTAAVQSALSRAIGETA
ncbi:hypothetical protein [Rhodovulum sp. FJ3]|uniref:hypothetical protein n=1 Tax=Rhodovulum sp. FJ3 TaxID=3079053 RepID=UPI00293DA352|nr:hypothetical protein [Rhodovulum sp. FJ3]MDV4169636.1 hypothetical protein [Rhodovulum sp. FJ3]